MYLFNWNEDWNEVEKTLEKALTEQDYDKINRVLYSTYLQKEALEWTKKYNLEHHAPLYYYQVRQAHLANFQDTEGKEPTEKHLERALILAFMCFMISLIHISESLELNKRYEILDIFCTKFNQKFALALQPHPEIFLKALNRVEVYFNKLLADLYRDGNTGARVIPYSSWIYTCQAGGWRQPALGFKSNQSKEAKEEIVSKFTTVSDYHKYKLAVKQGINSLQRVYAYLQECGSLDFNKGFDGTYLPKPKTGSIVDAEITIEDYKEFEKDHDVTTTK